MASSDPQETLLPKRELFALVAVPLLVGVIWWAPAWALLVVLGTATTIAADEFLGMARSSGVPCSRWVPLVLTVAVLAMSWIWNGPGLATAAVAVVIILPAIQLLNSDSPKGSLNGVAVSGFAVLFLGATGACLGWLRLWPDPELATRLLLLFLFTIWIGDSGAYYVGSRLGRHKMSPRVSPNKTWEGLAGGTIATVAAAAVINLIFSMPLPWIHLIAVAAILAVAAPLGDLVESQFKRDTGVKDSSMLIPGHGGFLDRTDSLLYAAPPVLGYLLIVGII